MAIKTVSLETAKALKEAGFAQVTYFFFVNTAARGMELHNHHVAKYAKDFPVPMEIIAAPTTDELLEELPIGSDRWTGHYRHLAVWPHSSDNWQCAYVLPVGEGYFGWQEGKSLPEAIAAMWLWLKKEGYL